MRHLLLQMHLLQVALLVTLLVTTAQLQIQRNNAAVLLLCGYMQVAAQRAQRASTAGRRWRMPRPSENYWTSFVNRPWENEEDRDREYRTAFRMSYVAFGQLCELLQPALERNPAVLRVRHEILDVRHIVACVLYRLARGDSLHAVGHLFGLGKSTVCTLTREVCAAINELLRPRMIRLPETDDQVQAVLQGFESKSGLPNCFGAVDSTHVKLKRKPDRRFFPGDYWSEHKQAYTLVMQAVVDSKGHFMDIDVRWPGRVSDSHIFRNSAFFTMFPAMYGRFARDFEGVTVPLYVVADSAYPLLRFCMKKFQRGILQPDSQYAPFDYAVQTARVVVENAFSRFKGRWRCMELLDMSCVYACDAISACATLHNYVELFDPSAPITVGTVPEHADTNDVADDSDTAGHAVRNALFQYMASDSD